MRTVDRMRLLFVRRPCRRCRGVSAGRCLEPTAWHVACFDMVCFVYLQVSYPRPGPLISFSEMVDY